MILLTLISHFFFSAHYEADEYTDLCFRDDPKLDSCIRERINDVVEQFYKGNNIYVCIICITYYLGQTEFFFK